MAEQGEPKPKPCQFSSVTSLCTRLKTATWTHWS